MTAPPVQIVEVRLKIEDCDDTDMSLTVSRCSIRRGNALRIFASLWSIDTSTSDGTISSTRIDDLPAVQWWSWHIESLDEDSNVMSSKDMFGASASMTLLPTANPQRKSYQIRVEMQGEHGDGVPVMSGTASVRVAHSSTPSNGECRVHRHHHQHNDGNENNDNDGDGTDTRSLGMATSGNTTVVEALRTRVRLICSGWQLRREDATALPLSPALHYAVSASHETTFAVARNQAPSPSSPSLPSSNVDDEELFLQRLKPDTVMEFVLPQGMWKLSVHIAAEGFSSIVYELDENIHAVEPVFVDPIQDRGEYQEANLIEAEKLSDTSRLLISATALLETTKQHVIVVDSGGVVDEKRVEMVGDMVNHVVSSVQRKQDTMHVDRITMKQFFDVVHSSAETLSQLDNQLNDNDGDGDGDGRNEENNVAKETRQNAAMKLDNVVEVLIEKMSAASAANGDGEDNYNETPSDQNRGISMSLMSSTSGLGSFVNLAAVALS